MQVNTLMQRARSGLGKNTRYSSPGVTPPLGAATWPSSGARIDCSGFLAWCLRISRVVNHPKYQAINGGWFETTGIHADVVSSWGFFEEMAMPEVGAFVVYPDHGGSEGHIGLVSAVNGGGGIGGIDRVIHCSFGGWSNHGDAIRETSASIWAGNPNARIGWNTNVT